MAMKKIIQDLNRAIEFEDKIYHATRLIDEVNNMINIIPGNEVEDIISILEENEVEIRQCTSCGKLMLDGYVVNDGLEYYCDNNCFDKEHGLDNLEDMYQNDEAYWTEFN